MQRVNSFVRMDNLSLLINASSVANTTYRRKTDERKDEMTAYKHTTGPWCCSPSVENDAEYSVYNEDGNVLTFDDSEHEANARLIAAAPDMLAALIEVEQMIHAGEFNGGTMGVVRAAIAKARGEQ